jgi:hypothetical protein
MFAIPDITPFIMDSSKMLAFKKHAANGSDERQSEAPSAEDRRVLVTQEGSKVR